MGVHVELGNFGRSTTGTNAPSFDGTQACKGLSTESFFYDNPEEALKRKAALKPICDTCRFNTPCLEWALKNREHGIWAGTTDFDRRRIKRKIKH
jgi:hypothetical protein